MPLGREVVVTDGRADTVICSAAVTEVCAPTATETLKLYVAPALALVGVPAIRPLALNVSPPGRAPETNDQVGVVPLPPLNASCWLYAVPATALDRESVVTTGGLGATVRVNDWDVVEGVAEESATLIENENVPNAVGVPVSAPVDGFSKMPAGKVPAETDHVRGALPPVPVRVVE